ncbi:MAG: rod shape-determining protein MreD [Anaerolineae bacterium]|nr:rod shape-determining protein MreD [Candidatus Roseilinea sp.]MDW8449281.1 rod shape-determining protein MreD [Anaerolineae bacterium]
MRRHIIAGIVITLLTVVESSLLPLLLGAGLRPNLTLVVCATWAALRGDEGFIWAIGGGLLLDLQSSAPFGTHTAGLMIGNALAATLDRAPIPVPILRTLNWVLITTVVYYVTSLIVLAFAGRTFDISIGFTAVVLPNLAANLILTVPAHIVLNRLQMRLREQERFLPER